MRLKFFHSERKGQLSPEGSYDRRSYAFTHTLSAYAPLDNGCVVIKSDQTRAFSKMEISASEREAINRYKRAAARLPECSLLEYELPDFAASSLAASASYDALQVYLKDAYTYTKRLCKAASLREAHYRAFVKGVREEDEGHRHWRRGLNALAQDAREKVEKWSQVSEDQFVHLLSNQPTIITLPETTITATHEPELLERENPVKLIRTSTTEAQRRAKMLRRTEKQRKLEEERLLDKAASAITPAPGYIVPELQKPSSSAAHMLDLCESNAALFVDDPPLSPLWVLQSPLEFGRWDCMASALKVVAMPKETLESASICFFLYLLARVEYFQAACQVIAYKGTRIPDLLFVLVVSSFRDLANRGTDIYFDVLSVCCTCYGVRCWLQQPRPPNHRKAILLQLRAFNQSRRTLLMRAASIRKVYHQVDAANALLKDTALALFRGRRPGLDVFGPLLKLNNYLRLNAELGALKDSRNAELPSKLTRDDVESLKEELAATGTKLSARRIRRLKTRHDKKVAVSTQKVHNRVCRAAQRRRARGKHVSVQKKRISSENLPDALIPVCSWTGLFIIFILVVSIATIILCLVRLF